MDLFLQNFANWQSFVTSWPLLLQGLQLTFLMSLAALPCSLVTGLVIALLYSFSTRRSRWVLIVIIDFLRSFPVLVLLILIFYSLPFFGLSLDAFTSVVLALTLNNTGYFGEIFRAGLELIPKGQYEASYALGFHRVHAMVWIILPQAIRRIIAPLATNALELVKTTSIAGLVGLPELLRSARVAEEQTYNPTPLTAAAIIFFVLLWPFAHWVSHLERRSIMARGAGR